MWKFLKSSKDDSVDDSIQFITTPGEFGGGRKGEGSHGRLSPRFNYGSIVPVATTGQDSPPRTNWLRRKRQMIFRKKTIYKKFPVAQWLPKYTFEDCLADLVAGLTVGVTVIPQALAYATVAGLPPQYGLYSSFIGCFLYVILGSAHAITIGPTALLALLTSDGATSMGPGAAVLLAFLKGCIEMTLGLLNFGFLIEFIAGPVIAGFTTASAFTIATTQVKSLLGLKFNADGFIGIWTAVFDHIEETRPWDAIMGLSSIFALIALRVLSELKLENRSGSRLKRFGNGLIWLLSTARNAVVILICSIIGAGLVAQGKHDILLLTGNITAGLPSFQPPPFYIEYKNETFNFGEISQKLGSAIVIAPVIGILESVSIAKTFAKGQKIDASQEMIAIGASNLLGSFFSSIPVTGSFSRTAVNAASGVHTPLGGIYTGSLVLLATSVLTPYFYFIPKSCLAAVICTAVITLVEFHFVKLVWRSRKIDLVPLLVTFFVCLLFSLEYGILIGTAINLAMLLYSTSRPRIKIHHHKATTSTAEHLLITPDRSLVFSAMDYFMSVVRKASMEHRQPRPLPIVIDLSHVSMADFTTAYSFRLLSEDMHKRGHRIILTRTQPRILNTLLGVGSNHFRINPEGSNINVLLEELTSSQTDNGDQSTAEDSQAEDFQ